MLHGAAARALEVQYADGLEEDVDDAAAGAGERAIAETTQAGDVPTLGKAHDVLARSGVWSGGLHQSVAEGRRVGAILEGTAERWWLGLARQGVAFGLGFPEAFHSAPEGAARTNALGQAIGDRRLRTSRRGQRLGPGRRRHARGASPVERSRPERRLPRAPAAAGPRGRGRPRVPGYFRSTVTDTGTGLDTMSNTGDRAWASRPSSAICSSVASALTRKVTWMAW
jgi:hypothetical protein